MTRGRRPQGHRAAMAWLACAASCVALAGCRTAPMERPPALAGAERLVVRGRDGWQVRQRVRFGQYEVRDIERSIERSSVADDQDSGRPQRRSQHYVFTVHEAETPRMAGDCDALFVSRDDDGWAFRADRFAWTLRCRLAPVGQPGQAWELTVAATDSALRPHGSLQPVDASSLEPRYEVRARSQTSGSGTPIDWWTVGWTVVAGPDAAAVVDLTDGQGAVYIRPSLAARERDSVVAAIVALLLHRGMGPGAAVP